MAPPTSAIRSDQNVAAIETNQTHPFGRAGDIGNALHQVEFFQHVMRIRNQGISTRFVTQKDRLVKQANGKVSVG
nr:hypothetical protein [Nitrosospira sp. Nsp1]